MSQFSVDKSVDNQLIPIINSTYYYYYLFIYYYSGRVEIKKYSGLRSA